MLQTYSNLDTYNYFDLNIYLEITYFYNLWIPHFPQLDNPKTLPILELKFYEI